MENGEELDLTTPRHILEGLQAAFREHGIGNLDLTTQPDGDLEVNAFIDKFGVQNFFEKLRNDAEADAYANGLPGIPPEQEMLLYEMEQSIGRLCEEGGTISLDNPVGKALGNLFGMEFDEQTMREMAAENDQPYIEKVNMSCGVGV